MKRILIVSPHFPPVNAPDMQRVRLALPFLRRHGWEPVVLAVAPEMIEGAVIEPLLTQTYPSDVRIVRVAGVRPQLTRWLGVGSLWLRCGSALQQEGDRMLAGEHFDLVFFSTTQFGALPLGPRWWRRNGIPYVLDFQDPWVNPYYRRTGTRPPGGWLKYTAVQALARRAEPRVLRQAAAVIAVSPGYGAALQARHPWFDARRVRVLPFGASTADLQLARRNPPSDPLIDFNDGRFHHVYTGRCGPDMRRALTILFRAFRRYLESAPANAVRIRLHFIGTSYAPRGLSSDSVMPIAHAERVSDFVREHCARIPYFEALHYVTNADALVAVGSDDPTYSASKIYPLVLAERPLLTLAHVNSPLLEFVRNHAAGLSYGYGGSDPDDRVATAVFRDWFAATAQHRASPGAADRHRMFSAETLSASLAGVFDEAVHRVDPQTVPGTTQP